MELLGPYPHVLTPTRPLLERGPSLPFPAQIPPVALALGRDLSRLWLPDPVLSHQQSKRSVSWLGVRSASQHGMKPQRLGLLHELPVVIDAARLDRVLAKVLLPKMGCFMQESLQNLPERAIKMLCVEGDLVQEALSVAIQGVGCQGPDVHPLE